MTRTRTGVAAGVVAGLLLLVIGSYVAHYLYPLPPDTGIAPTPDVMVRRAGAALLIALLFVHLLAAGVAGVTAGRIALEGPRPIWIAVGAFLVVAAAHLIVVPHPIWFVMLTVLLVSGVGFGLGRLARD